MPTPAAIVASLLMPVALPAPGDGSVGLPPEHLEVLPVFVVPQGSPAPTEGQKAKLMQHVAWSQARFDEMLDCRGTFTVSDDAPQVYRAEFSLEVYQGLFQGGVPQMTSEVMTHFGYSRFDAPHIYLMLVMNPQQDVPPGGGRPCNGGFNTGCGIIVMSSYALDHHPQFQSTLQHEFGHAFGLPHVDVYGYDMATSDSIMSYNPAHHTNFWEPSAMPGTLIPEDVRGLAYNDRAFPNLAFDKTRDQPLGYTLAPPVWLGPMTIPGQPEHQVAVATDSGETFGSSVEHVVQGQIKPSAGPGVTFDPGSMWSSDVTETGWVSVELTFPVPLELNAMTVHSEHSGLYHRAEHVRILASVDQNDVMVADTALEAADVRVPFEATTAQVWNVWFKAGESDMVVIRGLQFHHDDVERFPPFIPEPVTTSCPWDVDGDGRAGPGDLAAILDHWGPTACHPADVNGDNKVGPADLARLFDHWGPCE